MSSILFQHEFYNHFADFKGISSIFITYFHSQQATILKEELAGFVFESNRGTKHSFTAETSLGPEFSAGWGGKKSRKFRSKLDALRSKVSDWKLFCFSLECFCRYSAKDKAMLLTTSAKVSLHLNMTQY